MTTITRVQLKNASRRDSLVARLWDMVNANLMTDVTLVSADGHTIPIHKLILVTSSDYFRNMQRQGNLDKDLLEFQGISGSVLQELVRFMYTGSIYATYQSVLEIHNAASQLQMSDLVATCNVLIEQQIQSLQQQLKLQGNATLQGGTGLQGNATLQGGTGLQGNATLQGGTGLQGNATLQGGTGLQGNATLQGGTGLQGNATLQGGTGLQGSATLQGGAPLQGSATLLSGVALPGTSTLPGTFSNLQGNAALQGLALPNTPVSNTHQPLPGLPSDVTMDQSQSMLPNAQGVSNSKNTQLQRGAGRKELPILSPTNPIHSQGIPIFTQRNASNVPREIMPRAAFSSQSRTYPDDSVADLHSSLNTVPVNSGPSSLNSYSVILTSDPEMQASLQPRDLPLVPTTQDSTHAEQAFPPPEHPEPAELPPQLSKTTQNAKGSGEVFSSFVDTCRQAFATAPYEETAPLSPLTPPVPIALSVAPEVLVSTSKPAKKRGRKRKESTETPIVKKLLRLSPEKVVPSTSGFKKEIGSGSDEDHVADDGDTEYFPETNVRRVTRGSGKTRVLQTTRASKQKHVTKSSKKSAKLFTCGVCGDNFSSSVKRRKHKLLAHAGQRNKYPGIKLAKRLRSKSCRCKKINGGYVCRDCGRFSILKNAYRAHALVRHKKEPKMPLCEWKPIYHPCRECPRVFKHLDNYDKHIVVHGPMAAPMRLRRNKRVFRAVKEVLNKKQKRKRMNPQRTYKKRGIVKRKSGNDEKQVCPVCRMVIQDMKSLVDHIHLDHGIFTFALDQETKDQFAFQCPDCTKLPSNYSSFLSIKKHCEAKHNYDLSLSCFVCDKRFKTRAILAHHLHSAHRIKSLILKMDPLGKRYLYSDLWNNESSQDGLAIRCHFCKQGFADDSELFGHMRRVHFQYCEYEKMKSNPKRQKEDSYSCQACGVVVYNVRELQNHFLDHHGTILKESRVREPGKELPDILGKFRCQESGCYLEAEEEWDLVAHVENFHPEAQYGCKKCPFSTRLYSQSVQHARTHEGAYVCELCGRFCRKGPMLRYHKWKVHGVTDDGPVMVYRCDVEGCFFECHQKNSLAQHMTVHDPDRRFSCPQCGRQLKTQKSLEAHISRMHMNIRPYSCDQCGKSFTKPGEIKAHMKSHHADEAMSCEHCKFSTTNKYSLISHMLSRHGIQLREHEKLHQCPYCDYKTMRAKHLQNHVNSHLNKRDFICALCGKGFISASSLKGHHNWVHTEKQFKCEFCNYKGGALSNLKQHTRVMHTLRGLKPYKCYYCDFRCELSGNCRVHCRSAHKGMEVKWVKVVDFKSELPNEEQAEEIRRRQAEQKEKEKEIRAQEVRAVEHQKLAKNPTPITTASVVPAKTLTLEDEQGQLKTLLRTVTTELANIEREAQSQVQQQTQQQQQQQQQHILPALLSQALSQQPVGVKQQQQQQQNQQQLFTDESFQHQLIYMADNIPITTNTPSMARPTYYSTSGEVYDQRLLTSDSQRLLTSDSQRSTLPPDLQNQVYNSLYPASQSTANSNAHSLFIDGSLNN